MYVWCSYHVFALVAQIFYQTHVAYASQGLGASEKLANPCHHIAVPLESSWKDSLGGKYLFVVVGTSAESMFTLQVLAMVFVYSKDLQYIVAKDSTTPRIYILITHLL